MFVIIVPINSPKQCPVTFHDLLISFLFFSGNRTTHSFLINSPVALTAPSLNIADGSRSLNEVASRLSIVPDEIPYSQGNPNGQLPRIQELLTSLRQGVRNPTSNPARFPPVYFLDNKVSLEQRMQANRFQNELLEVMVKAQSEGTGPVAPPQHVTNPNNIR